MPGECRKRLDPCPNGVGHPSIADRQATPGLLDQHNYLGPSSGTSFGRSAAPSTMMFYVCASPMCRSKASDPVVTGGVSDAGAGTDLFQFGAELVAGRQYGIIP